MVVDFAQQKSFSVPVFLRKVFMEELGNNHKLVVTAIHAVLIGSGFVGFDPNTNLVVNRLCFPARMSSLYYTLPDIGTADTVVIKFQSLGKFISVYGSLSCGGGGKVATRMVRLNEEQLVPFLNVVWANCGVKESIEGQDEVLKFWRTVKDNLALPLLIDICEKAGLELPPCFMRLPTELKLKIVELLSAAEIAKVGSTCSEIMDLASTDELWKVKFEEEFGKDVKKMKNEWSWKKAFALHWQLRHTSRLFAASAEPQPLDMFGGRRFGYGRQPFPPPLYDMWPNFGGNFGYGRQPFPRPLFPGIRGRDYDMWPNFGGNFGGNAHLRFVHGCAHANCLNFWPQRYWEGHD